MSTLTPDLSHPAVRDAWAAYIEQTAQAREDYQHALADLARVHEEAVKTADAARNATVDNAWTAYHDLSAQAWASYLRATDEARHARDIAADAAQSGQAIL